jgi:transposase
MKTLTICEQMKYLSKDLKDRIIKRYLEKDMTRKEVAKYYEVSEALVKKVLAMNLREETLEQKIKKRTKKLQLYHVDYLRLVRDLKPSTRLDEYKKKLEEEFDLNVSESTLCVEFKELQWDMKKIVQLQKEKYTDENMEKYLWYAGWIAEQDPYKLKFFDECYVNRRDLNRTRGRSDRGESPEEEQYWGAGNSRYTINALTSLAHEFPLIYEIIDGPSNSLTLLDFFIVHVMSELQEGDIVVMDNCAFHKGYIKDVLRDLLDSIGVGLIFLPPYSPEFSPVEKVFGKLKKLLKRDEEECIPLAIPNALGEVCMEDMLGFYKDCYCF